MRSDFKTHTTKCLHIYIYIERERDMYTLYTVAKVAGRRDLGGSGKPLHVRVCVYALCNDPISADPSCPFPNASRTFGSSVWFFPDWGVDSEAPFGSPVCSSRKGRVDSGAPFGSPAWPFPQKGVNAKLLSEAPSGLFQ